MTRTHLFFGALSLPAAVVAIAGVWALVWNPGGGWLWPPDQVTMPEAIATGNYGEVAHQLRLGVNPNVAAPVRPGVLGPNATTLTPLQASVWARNPRMAHLLIDAGAVTGPSGVAILHCLNTLHGNDEIRAALDRLGPPASADCTALDVPH